MDPDDSQLIASYFNGDEDALTYLVHRHLPAVYNFVIRLVGPNEADDVAQEAFVKAWQMLHTFKPEGKFRAWILSIARNSAIDRLRKRKEILFSTFESETSFAETIPDDAPLPDEMSITAETISALEVALDSLSPLYREVVVLHDMEDLTFEEIAGIVGRPMNTVKSQYRRAIAVLRATIAPK